MSANLNPKESATVTPLSQDGDGDVSERASIDRPPSSHEGLPPSKVYHPLAFPVLALLIPGSIMGALARLGLQALATYEGQSIFPLAYAQSLGCLIMGFCLAIKEPFGLFYGPLYTAFTTGFCGSLTTFSGWQLDIFNSWVNAASSRRGGLRDFVDGIGKSVFTLSLSLGSVAFGMRLGHATKPYLRAPSPLKRTPRYAISVVSVLCLAAVFPTFFRLPTDFRHRATAALLFAYPGVLTRYFLSLGLNPLNPSFPVGTFAANMLGTALVATFHVLQSTRQPPSPTSCAILQGLIDGYCGCLTTVSTFAVEVVSFHIWKGSRYVLGSWVVAQLLLLVILGPSFWSAHVSKTITCSWN
ncbi:hypothetical protein HGRIS_009547 [Hohenbuehelia grisea]|uniref:CrcB-like protein n=1 Tax=Hohenbuehelia grisea TaxID=104357 RepID=A0ABR3J1X3_9AGAR